jgi:hypothetical protein
MVSDAVACPFSPELLDELSEVYVYDASEEDGRDLFMTDILRPPPNSDTWVSCGSGRTSLLALPWLLPLSAFRFAWRSAARCLYSYTSLLGDAVLAAHSLPISLLGEST